MKSTLQKEGALVSNNNSYADISGRNLYPYIRLGPRGRCESVDLTVYVTGAGADGETPFERKKVEV